MGYSMTNSQFEEQPTTLRERVTDSFTILHVNYLLTDLPGLEVIRNELPEKGEEWPPLVTEILDIPGVETVVLRPYGVGIHRAATFDFDRILPEVERLLYWLGNALSPFELDLQQESPSINQPEVPQSQLMPPPVHEPEHQERHKAIEGC